MNDYLFEEGDLGEYLGGHPDGGPTPSRAAPIVSPRAMRTAMRTATPASAASALAEAPREVAERPAPNRRLVVMLSLDDTELVLPRAPDDAATDGLAMLGCFHLRYVSRGRHAQLDLDVIQMSAGVTGRVPTPPPTHTRPRLHPATRMVGPCAWTPPPGRTQRA